MHKELFKTGQPLGLEDKNGQNICLGDTVKENWIDEDGEEKNSLYKVEYFNTVAAFGFVEIDTTAINNTTFWTEFDFCPEFFEIVEKVV